MRLLENKVAIVTGASFGIGYAAAKLFAREGASVVVGARRRAELDRLAAEIAAAKGRAIAVAADVRDEAFAADLVAIAARDLGGLHVAFNNAGDLSSFTTGTALLADGGVSINRTRRHARVRRTPTPRPPSRRS